MKLSNIPRLLFPSLFLSKTFRRLRYLAPALAFLTGSVSAAPKTILISLDGATPRLVDQYTASGALPPGIGLRLLEEKGVKASQNFTISPSLTAAAHIAIVKEIAAHPARGLIEMRSQNPVGAVIDALQRMLDLAEARRALAITGSPKNCERRLR